MKIRTYEKNGYRVVELLEDVAFNTDLTVLKETFQQILSDQCFRIALRFTPASYLYTESIAVIVECLEMVQDRQGAMAVISPNEDIMDVLKVIGFESIIAICDSDNDLK